VRERDFNATVRFRIGREHLQSRAGAHYVVCQRQYDAPSVTVVGDFVPRPIPQHTPYAAIAHLIPVAVSSSADRPRQVLDAVRSRFSGGRRILVADDHPVVRGGLVAMLRTIPGFEVVGEATTAEEALERIGNSVPPLLMRSIAAHVRGLVAP
jgi:hypothetical protein